MGGAPPRGSGAGIDRAGAAVRRRRGGAPRGPRPRTARRDPPRTSLDRGDRRRAAPPRARAVAFAAESGEGPLAARMRRVLWDVHLRTRTRIEDAFIALADACGSWNADLKRAGYVIAHAGRGGARGGGPRAA